MKTIVKPSATAASLAKEPMHLVGAPEDCPTRDLTPCGKNVRS